MALERQKCAQQHAFGLRLDAMVVHYKQLVLAQVAAERPPATSFLRVLPPVQSQRPFWHDRDFPTPEQLFSRVVDELRQSHPALKFDWTPAMPFYVGVSWAQAVNATATATPVASAAPRVAAHAQPRRHPLANSFSPSPLRTLSSMSTQTTPALTHTSAAPPPHSKSGPATDQYSSLISSLTSTSKD